jgi:hypothetical protein
MELLSVTANDFWLYRYRFDEPSGYKPKVVGADMVNRLLVNMVAPVLFAYGEYRGEEHYKTRAMSWLEDLKAEENRITRLYGLAGLSNCSAADSQSYVELKKEYCDPKRCLDCPVGNALVKPEQE